MNILIVHPSFWCYGGAELCIVKLANYLEEVGHKVTILTTQVIPDVRDDLKCEIIIVEQEEDLFNDLKREFQDIYKDYDVINFHNHPTELLLDKRYPSVWYCNEPPDYVLDHGFLPKEEKIKVINTISKVIVADNRNASRFKHYYGITPEVVHYGVDWNFWSKGEEDRHYFNTIYKFAILHSGMVHPRKNQLRSLQLVDNLKDQIKDIKLIFSGTIVHGQYFREMEEFIKEHNLEELVMFLGGIDRENLRDLYKSVDLLLHPIKDQGGWLTPFEAMSAQLPVIISSEANPSDLIAREKIGVVSSINDLEKHVLDFYHNKQKYQDMILKASNYVRRKLTWKNYARGVERVLKEVVK